MTLTKQLISEIALANIMADENRHKFDPSEVRLSAVGLCARKQVFGALEGVDPIEWHYDELGHYLQALVKRAIDLQGFPVREEVEVKHPWGIGHIDLVLDFKEPKIIECKSTKCSGLQYDLPKPAHLMQVRAQMMYSEIHQAEIVYMCRDHAAEHHKAFEVSFPTLTEREEIATNLERVFRGISEGVAPPVPFEKENWQCVYKVKDNGELKEISCPFRSRCWPEKEKPVAVPTVEVTDYEKARVIRDYRETLKYLADMKAKKEFLENEMVAQFGDFQRLKADSWIITRSMKTRTTTNYEKIVETIGLPAGFDLAQYQKTISFESFSFKDWTKL